MVDRGDKTEKYELAMRIKWWDTDNKEIGETGKGQGQRV